MTPHYDKYKSQNITVFVEEVDQQWRAKRVLVTGALLPWPIAGKYPQEKFATESEAVEYGRTAAKWVIDNPPPQSGCAKRCDPDEPKS
jgi:hypothetical protein